jgi:ribA/ribD-fused uncharacterized protein
MSIRELCSLLHSKQPNGYIYEVWKRLSDQEKMFLSEGAWAVLNNPDLVRNRFGLHSAYRLFDVLSQKGTEKDTRHKNNPRLEELLDLAALRLESPVQDYSSSEKATQPVAQTKHKPGSARHDSAPGQNKPIQGKPMQGKPIQEKIIYESIQLPSQASPILFSIDGNLSELSNYSILKTPMRYKNMFFPSSEHAFQSAKFIYPGVRPEGLEYGRLISVAKTPNIARVLGEQKIGGGYKWRTELNGPIQEYLNKGVKPRYDWERVKDNIMYEILIEKFTQDDNSKTALLSTGNRPLVEHSKDKYWGDGGNGQGLNKLGKLLEKVREKIREKVIRKEEVSREESSKEKKEVERLPRQLLPQIPQVLPQVSQQISQQLLPQMPPLPIIRPMPVINIKPLPVIKKKKARLTSRSEVEIHPRTNLSQNAPSEGENPEKPQKKPRKTGPRTKSKKTSAESPSNNPTKVFTKRYQKYDTPHPHYTKEPLQLYYLSLYKQKPNSALAIRWLTERGFFEGEERAKLEAKYEALN